MRRGWLPFLLLLALLAAPAGAQEPKEESEDAAVFHRALLEKVRATTAAEAQRNRQREERFQRARDEQAERLRTVQERVARAEAEAAALDTSYTENELEITRRTEHLTERLGQMGELYGVVRLVATDLSDQTWESLTTVGIGARNTVLDRLGRSKGIPSTADLERLWYELLREMTEQGRIATYAAPVRLGPETREERQVTRVGPFAAVAGSEYLRWDAGQQTLAALDRQPPPRYQGTVASYLTGAGANGVRLLAVDPSRGALLEALTDTPSFTERIGQGGTIGYTIVVLGFVALLLGAGRLVQLALTERRVAEQRDQERPSLDNPLGRVRSVYQENRSADPETLELKLGDAVLRETRWISRYFWVVQRISVIAPLLGLLGTVTGMIQTFEAITLFGTGDPKVMAGGISEALVTTMLGLVTAVPLVLLHALLSSRAQALTAVLDEESAGLLALRLQQPAQAVGGPALSAALPPAPGIDAGSSDENAAAEDGPSSPRYLGATAFALLVTLALFWAMQALISVGYQPLEGREVLGIEFVRLKRDTTPPETKRVPKRQKPEQPPPPPDISRARSDLDPGEGVATMAALIDPSSAVQTGIGGSGGSDRDVVPLVRTEPEYPAQAEARGITGWVTVEFTVARTGAVKDPRVIASKPPRIFDRAALAAVRRWKYNPKIEDGEAVERPRMRITFEFSP